MKKTTLYVMCGIPGSGKSTYTQMAKIGNEVAVVSRDEIRFSLLQPGDEYFSKENTVFKEFVERIKENLKYGIDTYADATHLNQGSRTKLLKALGTSLKDVTVKAIVVRPPVEVSLERNELRKGTSAYVPREVIRRMDAQFVFPTPEEGFDGIYLIKK